MLILMLVFEYGQVRDDQSMPYPLNLRGSPEESESLFPIYLHHLFDPSRKKDNRVMSRRRNCCGDKANLLFFD